MSRIVLTVIEGPNLGHTPRYSLQPGQVQMITHRPDYLVSPGQSCDLMVSAQAMDGHTAPGDRLVWAPQHIFEGMCAHVPMSWDYTSLPSSRTLWSILAEVADHGKEYPNHGYNCVCMDPYARELREHIGRAMPPSAGRDEQGEIHDRVGARNRMRHVLMMAMREL